MKTIKFLDPKQKHKSKNFKTWQQLLIFAILTLIFVASTALFYHQAIADPLDYLSDLPLHISLALDPEAQDYSLTAPIYRFIYIHLGGNFGIAIFLAIFVVLSIWATKRLLDYHTKKDNDFSTWLWAILLNFVIAIHLPWITKYFNLGLQEPSEWHNSTYIVMKFFALSSLLLYFKMSETYLKKIETKDYILFTLLLLIANAVKPSFVIIFAPVMLVYLCIDFFKNIKNKKAIINIFIFGSAVLLSLSVLVYQNLVLFGGESSGIGFSYMEFLKTWHPYPFVSLLQSFAFPLFILLTNLKTVFKNRKFAFSYGMGFLGLFIYLFVNETGARATHGNFSWNCSIGSMVMFAAALSVLCARKLKDTRPAYLAAAYLLFALHAVSGLVYFVHLLSGASFV